MFIFSCFLAVVAARHSIGKCLNLEENGLKNLDDKKYQGLWYEIQRDNMTYFEWGGMCNRHELVSVNDSDKMSHLLLQDPEKPEIPVAEEYELHYHIKNYQHGPLSTDHTYDGIIECKKLAPNSCKIDFNEHAFGGSVGHADSYAVLDTDYTSWAVTYICEQLPFNVKNEWVYILSRTSTLGLREKQAAYAALKQKLEDYQLEDLTDVD